MRQIALSIALAIGAPLVLAEEFDRASLDGMWAESVSGSFACRPDNLHHRLVLSDDMKTLTFKLDRPWKLVGTGKVVEQYSATVTRMSSRSLFIRYDTDAGTAATDYPKEWELRIVGPGVYRWRSTDWKPEQFNSVIGVKCAS